jgi:AraC family transcriptional regulator
VGHEPSLPTADGRSNPLKTSFQVDQVSIIHFTPTRVATLEHRGDPKLLGTSVRNFIAWRKQNNLPPKLSATFNIVYDTPMDANHDDYHFDLCAVTDTDVAPNPFGIISKMIPGGRCAVLRHLGSDDHLGDTVTYLYTQWLPNSGAELRDFPMFFQRVSFPPEVLEQDAITDVFLPLK